METTHIMGLGHSGLPCSALHSSSTYICTYTCMYSYNSICTYINTQCNMSTDAYVGAYNTYICMYVYHITPIYLYVMHIRTYAYDNSLMYVCMYVCM